MTTKKNNSSAVLYGRKFNTVLFFSEKKANSFMESNEDYGVLLVDDTGIHLAKRSDKGVPTECVHVPAGETRTKIALRLYDERDNHIDTAWFPKDQYKSMNRKEITQLLIEQYQEEHRSKIAFYTEVLK
jgi:hypothetical protein